MGRLSAIAGIGASVLAMAAGEADAHSRRVHRNYIHPGHVNPVVVMHRGIPVSGNYFGGYFSTGNLRIDFSSYEVMPQPVFYPAPAFYPIPVIREYVEYTSPVHYRPAVPYEEMTTPSYPRSVTEEDGEDALYHALDGRRGFRWKKYVEACNGQFLQVDAVVGRKIIDVVPTEEEARRRSGMLPGHEYIPIVVNDFGTPDEIRGAVRQETR